VKAPAKALITVAVLALVVLTAWALADAVSGVHPNAGDPAPCPSRPTEARGGIYQCLNIYGPVAQAGPPWPLVLLFAIAIAGATLVVAAAARAARRAGSRHSLEDDRRE
jgi:hypothetical protein